jgi:MinD-like ATPase involved in chromosome partitioning or flagellar assembly
MSETAALVGATGGAGTTRLSVEAAALLAADGAEVAVLDAALATQGLSDHLAGRLSPDLTALVTDRTDEALAAGLTDLGTDGPGRVACCPAAAPFERLARAKAPAAARRLEERIDEAATAFDAVLVDTPPVAANQAVAAVEACDRVAVVAPATDRGANAVARIRARLEDVDAPADAVVATRGEREFADAAVPTAPADAAVPAAPAGGAFGAGVARATEAVLDGSVTAPDEGGLLDGLRDRL